MTESENPAAEILFRKFNVRSHYQFSQLIRLKRKQLFVRTSKYKGPKIQVRTCGDLTWRPQKKCFGIRAKIQSLHFL
jgi:hypothetical protein